MASTYSFDLVSEFDRQEVVNAIDQTTREINSRYDLKDTKTVLGLKDNLITINTASDMTLTAVRDILQAKAAKRSLSLKIFDYGQVESVSGNRVQQQIVLKQGIDQDIAKQISKQIRDKFKKVQPSIQGDILRISSKDKDDLQEVIQFLKEEEYPISLQFTNYR